MSTHQVVSPESSGSSLHPGTRRGLRPLRRQSRRERSDGALHRGHTLRRLHECEDPTPSQELRSRAALAPGFADLNRYAATMHFVGQSTVLSLTRDRATGEAYTLAHHLTIEGGQRRLMIAALRYDDTFVKENGSWLFSERKLYVDWLEERALS